MFSYAGNTQYAFTPQQTLAGQKSREVSQTYQGYVQSAYKSNGVIFACMMARARLFSEARFQFRQMRLGRPGDLFGTQELAILEEPWPNGQTGDLLMRMIQDVDLEGNFYAYRDGDVVRRMRPDWTSIALGSQSLPDNPQWAADAEILGYGYHPGGYNSSVDPIPLRVEQVAHWAPIPDPQAHYRGMSWLTPVMREVLADNAATDHKLAFFDHGATVNMVVQMDPSTTAELFDKFVKEFKDGHEGARNAYKTIFLAGGATAMPVGSNFQQMDFKVVQGAGETRVAAAAGVPPVIVGLSEGLAAATYSNYGQARRAFADGTMRPLWRSACAALETIVTTPAPAELWYDDRDIQFLQEDQADAATIQQTQATTVHTLIAAGFQPDSVIAAILNHDFARLSHTGLYSVQLQPAGAVTEGKGAVITGSIGPAGASGSEAYPGKTGPAVTPRRPPGTVKPAALAQASVRALLEPFLPDHDDVVDAEEANP
jgi:phage portal protein BeeE